MYRQKFYNNGNVKYEKSIAYDKIETNCYLSEVMSLSKSLETKLYSRNLSIVERNLIIMNGDLLIIPCRRGNNRNN